MAAPAGTGRIVAKASSGVPTPGPFGVARPQVRALAGVVLVIITIFRGGRLPSTVTRG
jgi:hypothetical protein